jgi:predicted acylesterase/phospholipase RssA
VSELRAVLIMGGGVSLGSFSGGALARTLRLLTEHSRVPARVDVMTGASAGSMTLGLAAYHLYRGSPLEAIERDLREAWVERIAFDGLEPADLTAHDQPSLFTDRRIREIAGAVLDFGEWTERPPHALFADGLLVSFALTNLNGVPVRAEGQIIRQAEAGGGPPSGERSVFADALQTTFHDDVVRFVLRRPPQGAEEGSLAEWRAAAEREAATQHARLLLPWTDDPMRRRWESFREAAVASGAFPGAFPPVRLARAREEYGAWPEELESGSFAFDYLDGGILRNEPLREAIHLASAQRGGGDPERVFILIDPNVSGTRELYPLGFNQAVQLAQKADSGGRPQREQLEVPTYMNRLMGVLGRAGAVLASQATYRDWLKAARVNSQVEWRDQAEAIIRELVPAPGSQVEARVDALLTAIYEEKALRSGAAAEGDPQLPEAAAAGLRRDLERRAAGGTIDFPLRLLHLVDLIANLRAKRKLNMVAITPASVPPGTSTTLAGNFLSNFGGFFRRSYREHDYLKGAFVADQVLHAQIGDATPLLRGGARRVPEPAAPQPDPDYLSLDAQTRQRFEALVRHHAREAIAGFGVPPLLRGPIADRVRDRVRDSLVKSAGPTVFLLVRIENARGFFLRGGPRGDDLRADAEDAIQTVVGLQQHPERTGYRIFGPHLQQASTDTLALLEVRAPGGFLRPSRPVCTISLTGEAADWFTRLRRCGVPSVQVRLNGSAGDHAIRPEQIVPDAFPLG